MSSIHMMYIVNDAQEKRRGKQKERENKKKGKTSI
jgi:hypothetical protein